MEKTIKIFKNFKDAEKADIEYWRNASYDERFKTLEAIRYISYKMINCNDYKIKKVVKIRNRKDQE